MTVAEYNDCVDQYADGIYRFILKNVKQEADAQDVVQNAFEILWTKKDEVGVSKARSYLYTVAYHNMIDNIRKTKRMDYRETVPEQERVAQNAYTGATEAIDQALQRLPDVQRQAVLLRDYEGYSYEEIGDILQLTESQVKVYIFRARKSLQQFLTSIDLIV